MESFLDTSCQVLGQALTLTDKALAGEACRLRQTDGGVGWPGRDRLAAGGAVGVGVGDCAAGSTVTSVYLAEAAYWGCG